jgi:hypothetical protein
MRPFPNFENFFFTFVHRLFAGEIGLDTDLTQLSCATDDKLLFGSTMVGGFPFVVSRFSTTRSYMSDVLDQQSTIKCALTCYGPASLIHDVR